MCCVCVCSILDHFDERCYQVMSRDGGKGLRTLDSAGR